MREYRRQQQRGEGRRGGTVRYTVPLKHEAPPPQSQAEQQSGAGRSLSPTINSGISFPSSGSQRGHSEGAGAERRGRRKGKSKSDRKRGGERDENRQIDREGEAVIGITQLLFHSRSSCHSVLLPPDTGER